MALHLLLRDDVPDAGQPVGQQEESHHQQDQDQAAVLGVPDTKSGQVRSGQVRSGGEVSEFH